MRITSGIHKGRILNSPEDKAIRPTSDKVRQAIFNSLESYAVIHQADVLDAFCGTGALGLEALSRGAASCDFYDISRQSLNLCQSNVAMLKEEGRTQLMCKNVLNIADRHDQNPYSLIFLDPPYNKGLAVDALEALFDKNWVAELGIFVIETDKNENISNDKIEILKEKIYGDTKITLARSLL